MKTLNITPITDTARMPIKKGTLQFLQDAHIENVSDIISALRGTNVYSLNPVVLWGCVNSGSGLTYNISEGAVIFLGTIYKVDATAFTASIGQVAIFNVVTTQYTTDADPVTFTDSVARNVHDIKKIVISAGTSGLYDYSNFEYYDFAIEAAIAVEKARAEGVESGLQTAINLINGAWTLRSNIADITYTVSGIGVTVDTSSIKYKIVDKTIQIVWYAEITNTINAPTAFFILIPASKTANIGFDFYSESIMLDAGAKVECITKIETANNTKIKVYPKSGVTLSTGVTTISGTITFEIA